VYNMEVYWNMRQNELRKTMTTLRLGLDLMDAVLIEMEDRINDSKRIRKKPKS
jgi:hypothetical protein